VFKIIGVKDTVGGILGWLDTIHWCMRVNSCVEHEVFVAKIKETRFLAIFFHFGLWMGGCAVLWGNCVVCLGGSGHHKWCDGMARHLLLAHGMHLWEII
jgi:hypothetical protein